MGLIGKFFKALLGISDNNQKSETEKQSHKQENPVNPQNVSQKIYQKKKLMTPTELKYFYALKNSVPEGYILQPQINLASIIERTDEHRYQNELYRNVDFVIFNTTYEPIVLIEINDKTHKEKSRIARDYKVKDICQAANLPLITFWTDYGINQGYINKRIAEYCPKDTIAV